MLEITLAQFSDLKNISRDKGCQYPSLGKSQNLNILHVWQESSWGLQTFSSQSLGSCFAFWYQILFPTWSVLDKRKQQLYFPWIIYPQRFSEGGKWITIPRVGEYNRKCSHWYYSSIQNAVIIKISWMILKCVN